MPPFKKSNIIGGCLAIAVLLVLVAVLFPVFVKQSGSPINSCLSNERQVGLALLQYVQDYNEKFPIGLNKTGVGWAGTVQDYVKSTRVFHCPQDQTSAADSMSVDSYAANSNIIDKKAGGSLDSIGAPPQTVMAFEISGDTARMDLPDEGRSAGATSFSAVGNGTDGSLRAGSANAKYATGYMGKRPVSQGMTQFDSPTGRHTDGANYLLGDGHVRWFGPNQVSTGADAKNKNDGQTGGLVGRAAGTGDAAYAATFSTK